MKNRDKNFTKAISEAVSKSIITYEDYAYNIEVGEFLSFVDHFDPALVSSIMDTINYKYKKLVRRYFYNKVNDLDDLENIEYRSNYFNKSVYDFTINNLIFKVIVLPIDNLNLNNFIRLVMQELKYDAENEADSFID